MKTTTAFFALLALLVLSYSILRSRSQTKIVNTDQSPSPHWTKVGIPLRVSHEDGLGLAYAQGFWQSTSLSKERQLVLPIAAKIECNNSDKTCRESEASVLLGVLQADLVEYYVASWTMDGIVAESDEGNCGIGHRLSLDFKSNSVTVTDYPKKVSTDKNCRPFQDADSYSLRGGQLALYPPAPWDPIAKAEWSK